MKTYARIENQRVAEIVSLNVSLKNSITRR